MATAIQMIAKIQFSTITLQILSYTAQIYIPPVPNRRTPLTYFISFMEKE